MSIFRELFAFNRAETFALVLVLAVLCVGGGILLYQKMTQSLPAELFFESVEVEESRPSTKPQPIVRTPVSRQVASTLTAIETHKINLNSAPAESLIMLPHVGPVIAERIIKYRNQVAGFDSVGQLIEVRGIGPKRLSSLRRYLKINSSSE